MLPHRATIFRCLGVLRIEHESSMGLSANTQNRNVIVIWSLLCLLNRELCAIVSDHEKNSDVE